MNQIVRGPGMAGILVEHFLDDRRRSHVGSGVAAVVTGAEQRQGVKGGRVEIVGIGLHQALRRLGVGEIARQLLAVAVEDLDRFEVGLLARCGRRGAPRFGSRRQLPERLTGGVQILLVPQRVIVGHRFAPGGHCEAGLDLARFLKSLARVDVLEAVQRQEPFEELFLSCR